MAKKKNKQVRVFLQSDNLVLTLSQVLRPWCWYCEREFEDEKGYSLYLSVYCLPLT